MTDGAMFLDLQAGTHSSATDFTSTPGSLGRLMLLKHAGLLPRGRNDIERPLYAFDGRRYPRIHGARSLNQIDLGMEWRMTNSPTPTVTPLTDSEPARLLNSIFGADAATISTSSAIAGGSTPNLTATNTNIADGDIIIFQTSTRSYVRRVVSGGGTINLVLDRAYAGTPSNGTSIYKLMRWNWDTTITAPKHLYFLAEGQSWRRDYFGCAPKSAKWTINNGAVMFDTSWLPSNYDDIAEANPTFADSPIGNYVAVGIGSVYFWIGNTSYHVKNLEISVDTGAVPRESTAAEAGVSGYVTADRRNVTLSGTAYWGANADEFVDTSVDAMDVAMGAVDTYSGRVADTYDVAVELCGGDNSATPASYWRFPAMDFRARVEEENGLAVVKFTGYATPGASGTYPLELGHL